MKRLELAGDVLIGIAPLLPSCFIDEIKVETEARPNTHLVGRPDRNSQEPFEFQFRIALLTEPFRDIRTDRFRSPANLIAKHTLLDPWKGQACSMNFESNSVRLLKDLEVFERSNRTASRAHLIPEFCILISESMTSVHSLSPVTFSAQEPLSRPVSCYAFFK